jgi:hypothetical protein
VRVSHELVRIDRLQRNAFWTKLKSKTWLDGISFSMPLRL